MRPKQWVKNLLVFAAPAAAGVLADGEPLLRTVATALCFVAVAGAGYLVNDVVDAPADRLHPEKRLRPIADGRIEARVALTAGAGLALVGLAGALAIRPLVGALLLAYLVVTVTYSLALKRVVAVDLLAIAAGFVLRAVAGGAAVYVPVTAWFVVVVALGALAVATGKRSSELAQVPGRGPSPRSVLAHYSPRFLALVGSGALVGTLIGYVSWTVEVADDAHIGPRVWFAASVLPFAVALLRYGTAMARGEAEAPEVALFADRWLLVAAGAWLTLFLIGVGLG